MHDSPPSIADPKQDPLLPITLDRIDPDAAKVVRRLGRFGFTAYLVGGCVRDLLLGRKPKDFDVATNATPQEIRKLFRNCRIIGRRFRLAHIFFGDNIIETSTFRAPPSAGPPEAEMADDLLIRRDNTFGTEEEDARRRDFTINGLFCDPIRGQVIDYVEGLADLRAGRVRTIGDPRIRVQEDPVRIIRAIKFAARLDFMLDPATEEAMIEFRGLIARCSAARVLEEIYRLLGTGFSAESVRAMQRTGVLAVLLPEIQPLLGLPDHPLARAPVESICSPSRPSAPTSAEELPRDAEPEPLVEQDGQSAKALSGGNGPSSEALEELPSVEDLLVDLLGEDPGARQTSALRLSSQLAAIDDWLRTATPAALPSHSLLLGNVLMGLAWRAVSREVEPRHGGVLVGELVESVGRRLGVSRKDRERLLQLLLAQRHLAHPGRRSRPASLVRRDYFADALTLLELSHRATGRHGDALARWRQLMEPGASPSCPSKRRRRRTRRSKGWTGEKTPGAPVPGD
jgi:poly(A) polymerase